MLTAIEYFTKSLKVIEIGTIQKLGYGFLFAFHSNYGSILYHFAIFSYPLHSTPPFGDDCRNIEIPFGIEQELSCRKQIARQLRTQSSRASIDLITHDLEI